MVRMLKRLMSHLFGFEFTHSTKEHKLYWRRWFHFKRGVISYDVNCWTHFCGFSIDVNDERWCFHIAFPPVAFWFSVSGFGLWHPTYQTIATWDNNRPLTLRDSRECSISIHDWSIWIHPWSRSMEWRKSDPWWIRGVTLHPLDWIFGRFDGSKTEGESFDIQIPMPEGIYVGHVTVEHWTRGRKRWFKKRESSAWITLDGGGIPFPGKGENSWDCGMDGLCGYGCSSLKPEDIIAKGVQSVLESRRRYAGSVNWIPEKSLS